MKIYKEEKKSTQENTNSFDSPCSLRKRRKMNRRNLPRGTREDPGTNMRKIQNERMATRGREMDYKDTKEKFKSPSIGDARIKGSNCSHGTHRCSK